MDNRSWQDQVTLRIEKGVAGLSRGAGRRLRPAVLNRITRRLGQFSAGGCEECDRLKNTLEYLVHQIEHQAEHRAIDYREYQQKLLVLVKHLKSAHGLIEPGTYVSLGVALGLLVGITLQNWWGTAYLGIGFCLGIAVGGMMDAKAKKNDKEI